MLPCTELVFTYDQYMEPLWAQCSRGLLTRKIDPDDGRAYRLTLMPQSKKIAVHVIGAFDRLQKAFERNAGKVSLHEMIKTIKKVDEAFQRGISKVR